MHAEERSRALGLALVVLATACWSTSGLFITAVLRGSGVTPAGLAFWRDLGTFLFLFAGLAAFQPGLLKVERRDLPWLVAIGAVSIGLFHVLWNTSVLLLGVSVSTILQANAPIFVTVAAWFLWREPLSPRKIGAIGLAVAGTGFIARPQAVGVTSLTAGGLLVGIGVAATLASFSLFGKRLGRRYSAWTILLYAFGFGALTLLPFQVGRQAPWPVPLPTVGAFSALVLLTTVVGFALYTSGLRRLQASVASIAANTEVPFAAILSNLVLGEHLDGLQVLGAVLILGGVTLVSLPRAR